MHSTKELCHSCVHDCARYVRTRAKNHFRQFGSARGDAIYDTSLSKSRRDLVFIDKKGDTKAVASPALFHVIFRDIRFVDIDSVHRFMQLFAQCGPLATQREISGRRADEWCTMNSGVPHVYLQSAIIRTCDAVMYDHPCPPVNIVFVFNVYPACGRNESLDGSLMAGMSRPSTFVAHLDSWISRATIHIDARRKAREMLQADACARANASVACEMIEHVFSQNVCGRLIKPDSVDAVWMSSCLAKSASVRKNGTLADSGDGDSSHFAAIGRQHCSDVVIRACWKLPVYLESLISRWENQYKEDTPSPPWAFDRAWKLVNIIFEQPSVADVSNVGAIFFCLVFVDEDALARAERDADDALRGTAASSTSALSFVSSMIPRVSGRASQKRARDGAKSVTFAPGIATGAKRRRGYA